MTRTDPSAELRAAGVIYGHADDPQAASAAPALSEVTFSVDPGECVLLAGGSGCGKSTALRRLNGLVPHFHPARVTGQAFTMGLDPAAAQLHDVGLRAATVMQNPRIQFFTGDVDAELAFAGENAGEDPTVIRERMDRATALTGIAPLRGRELSTLSGGQLQKVACAVALAQDPGLVLLDEPSSNLSPAAIEELATILRRLKDAGLAIVVAEHRLYYLRGIADRALLFDSGRIAEEMDAERLWSLSAPERAARGLRDTDKTPMPAPDEVIGGAGRAARPSAQQCSAARGSIELRDVVVRAGRTTILDIPRVEFAPGAVTALIGPNGAGKSTLARTIAGLREPARGSVRIGGAATHAAGRREVCSLVMQDVSRQLFGESVSSELTVGLPKERARALDTGQLLEHMDLTAMAERHPLSLSGGQQQRLVIAAAMATGRHVHLLDEPTSGVDLRRMHLIARHLRQLADAGDTVIVITHDAELVRACADRVIKLLPHPDCAAPGEAEMDT